MSSPQEQRYNKFVDLKKKIILCMDDLDQLPETSFEKDLVCEDEEAFCLSTDNIDSLKVLLHQVRISLSDRRVLSLISAPVKCYKMQNAQ